MKSITLWTSGLFAAALMALAFWIWAQTPHLVMQYDVARPKLMHWALRSAAVAIMAIAQAIILVAVIGRLYTSPALDRALRITAAVTCVLASLCALSLGLAGR